MLSAVRNLKGNAMEKGNALRLSRRHTSILVSALQHTNERIQTWWSRRRTARVLPELSAEQILDCGIESPELNVPIIEVPRGLMQKLMSMH
jgi:uncharacterized protein YjiS (DUF1127 family)